MLHHRIMFALIFATLCGCQDKKVVPAASVKDVDDIKVVPAESVKDVDEIAVSCLYIDRCLARMELEKDNLLSDRAASIIQSAERTLPVFWGVEQKSLSKETSAKIDGYPAEIRSWMDRINEKKAEAALKEINALHSANAEWQQAHQNDGTKWQEWIEQIDECIAKMQRHLASMAAGKSLDQAVEILLRKQKFVNHCRHMQLTEYQKKALRRCHNFLDYTLSNTIRSVDTLNWKFGEQEIAKIDSNLLGSDARRIYDIAVSRMDGLRDRDRAQFLLMLSGAIKWPLSDY